MNGYSLKRKHVIVLSLVVLVVLALGLRHYSLQPSDPIYDDRHLSSWIGDLREPSTDRNDTNETVKAIRAIGTNGLPFLVKQLQLKYSRPRKWIIELSEKQSLVRLHWKSDLEKRSEAAYVLITLGDAARATIPDLTALLQDEKLADDVGFVLASLGRDGYQALATGLTNRNEEVRSWSAINFVFIEAMNPTNSQSAAVLKYQLDAEVGIPALLGALHDQNSRVARMAATALGLIRRETNLVVPELRLLAEDTNATASVRNAAQKSLARFNVYTNATQPAQNQPSNQIQK